LTGAEPATATPVEKSLAHKHPEPGRFFPLQAGPHCFPERYSYISFFAGKKHGKAKSKKPLTSKTIFVMFGNDVYRSIMPNI